MKKIYARAIRRMLVAVVLAPMAADAQWSTVSEQVYLPGPFNWQFRKNYPAADRLFNAFDYGHAILYEKLWTKPGAPVSLLEEQEYAFITQKLLVNPPDLPLEEAAIEIAYVKMAPEAKMMFEWAHLLHRQIYDVWADERMHQSEKDSRVRQLLQYYKSRRDLAFSSVPKNMDLMEGQPYSLAFRQKYPKFNGLIWAYHWLQVGLYEPLLAGKNKDERQTGVLATVARFRQMIENPPTDMPRVMPMTPAVAPLFTARYPEAAIIFDNLHSMHDVISDILANPNVPRNRKREAILEAARRYRDDTSYVMTRTEWLDMAKAMGVQNMGGPVTGFLAGFPEPTVERGAVMDHADHAAPAAAGDPVDHAAMGHTAPPAPAAPAPRGFTGNHEEDLMMSFFERLTADSVIMRRVRADTTLSRLLRETMGSHATSAGKPAGSLPAKAPAAAKPKAKAPAKPKATVKPKPKPKAPPKTDPHAGMKH
jgi:hypothetical protein